MGILDIFSSNRNKSGRGLIVSYELIPYHLNIKDKNGSVLVKVTIKNETDKDLLLSMKAALPEELSFSQTVGVDKTREFEIGDIKVNEKKEISFEVFPSPSIKEGSFKIALNIMRHPLGNKDLIESEIRKDIEIKAL
ncbi:MAG: hypothetical protein ARM1_0749 [Candidatus Micrarchaeota archaeon]|nr:MAG: hypothetical protein ARM1_0749 [Candidatus Micrarchaeota archaeon]